MDYKSYKVYPQLCNNLESFDVCTVNLKLWKMTYKYTITGMSCDGCRTKVEKTLNAMQGAQAVVTLNPPIATISMENPSKLCIFKNCFQLRVITRSRFSIQMMLYYQQKSP
jgi:hypothetical protein